MQIRKLTSLTDAEIKEIVNQLFHAKKITCIRRRKHDDIITCKIYTEWDTEDPVVIADELTMYNPFSWTRPLRVDFSLSADDYNLYRKLCLEKGIVPDWIADCPHILWKPDVLEILDEVSKQCDSETCEQLKTKINTL